MRTGLRVGEIEGCNHSSNQVWDACVVNRRWSRLAPQATDAAESRNRRMLVRNSEIWFQLGMVGDAKFSSVRSSQAGIVH
jgi:hypothetical protein